MTPYYANKAHKDGVAKLKRLGLQSTQDLDKWIADHPIRVGSRKVGYSRFGALKKLVGEEAATWILHDMATSVLPGLKPKGMRRRKAL